MDNQYENPGTETFNITHFIIRLVVGAIVLAITAALTPGFTIAGIWPLLLGAVVLAALDYVALKLLGVNATPFGRGITGFILAAVIIYVTQFFVAGFNVTWWGAIIGALVYGLVDLVIPGRAM
ncbi:MAG: phage holin family protein [Firmicutes bacterium]|nr:phage holin family protein [Bacillota bacterium]